MQPVSRKVYVGLGSNLGEREHLIRSALAELAQVPATAVVRASSLYDSEPVGEIEQPPFLNAVAQLETDLPPQRLLWHLHLIEARLGRVRARRWGPRTIDLDLLFYGQTVLDEEGLTLPHPEIVHRGFVLAPLVELDPGFVHPVTGLTLIEHLKQLRPSGGVKRKGTLWL